MNVCALINVGRIALSLPDRPYSCTQCSVRVLKQDIYLYPDLEVWTLPIANGGHTEKSGRLELLFRTQNRRLSVNGNLSLYCVAWSATNSRLLVLCSPGVW